MTCTGCSRRRVVSAGSTGCAGLWSPNLHRTLVGLDQGDVATSYRGIPLRTRARSETCSSIRAAARAAARISASAPKAPRGEAISVAGVTQVTVADAVGLPQPYVSDVARQR